MLDVIGLGAVAGLFPVYLGIVAALYLGRVLPRTWEGGLIGVANGVLVYLFFDLMHEATEQTGARDPVSWLVFLGSLGVSFVGLVALESSQVFGARSGNRILSLPYMIAVGMGLHNLGEGLAIGASYAGGEYTLSALLVAGFGLHNGTEGFGIVGAAGKHRYPGAMWRCSGSLPGCRPVWARFSAGRAYPPTSRSAFMHWRQGHCSMWCSRSR